MISEVCGALAFREAKYDAEEGDMRPDEKEVAAVLVNRTGERGADDEEEDRPSRARSILKLDSLEIGGKGDEQLRLRD